ncbi:MAG: hypothetical protein M3P08_21250 [Thermoproteota archaeon]|nr:hypothetical protein [Thermoproteota archaeon]
MINLDYCSCKRRSQLRPSKVDEAMCVKNYSCIFRDPWRNGIKAKDMIKATETDVNIRDVEVIQNSSRVQEIFLNKPLNRNQLTSDLKLNYKAIQHHLRIFKKNNLITRIGERYGAPFFISTFIEVRMKVYDEVGYES